MKRLTDKRFAKEGYFELTKEERDSLYIPSVEEIYRKLAEYEDMEEKGDLIKVKHGKWVKLNINYNVTDAYKCSLCNRHLYVDKGTTKEMILKIAPYCQCGAKMDK